MLVMSMRQVLCLLVACLTIVVAGRKEHELDGDSVKAGGGVQQTEDLTSLSKLFTMTSYLERLHC